jgi:hypothetical protein
MAGPHRGITGVTLERHASETGHRKKSIPGSPYLQRAPQIISSSGVINARKPASLVRKAPDNRPLASASQGTGNATIL